MKICASCGASLPEQATFCVSCGSTDIREEGYAQQYEYENSYDNNGYGNQYAEPYQDDGYDNQYDNQYQNGYGNQYAEQYQDDGYGNQYAEQYEDEGYDDQYGNQYQNGYGDQYAEQYQDNGYEEPYAAQPQPRPQPYSVPQPQPRPQPHPVPQSQPQPLPVSPQPEPEPQSQPPVNEAQPVNEAVENAEEPAENVDILEKIKAQEENIDPYESSKDFKFEKKEEEPVEEGPKEKPKNIKEFIAMLRDTKDYTILQDRNDMQVNRNICIIACLGITFWVPLVFKGGSRVGRFYANQGLLIFITSIASSILYGIFSGIIGVACTTYTTFGLTETVATLSVGGIILDILFFALCYAVPIFLFVCGFLDIRSGKVRDLPLVGKIHLIGQR